jgi:ketosteroid isomerase-like protein
MGTLEAQNRQVVERYWEAHFLRDWEAMAGFFAADAHYTDVGVDGQGARGPQQIVDRLKIGIEPLSGYYHHPRHIVAEGDLVILEHVEEWQFHTGERIMHPFVTVMEVRGGRIVRWHDYSNIGNVIDHAPQWWLERIAQGYAAVGQ